MDRSGGTVAGMWRERTRPEDIALYAHPAPATVEMREAAIELLSHLKLYVMEKLEGIDADMLHDRMYDLTAALAPATEGRKG